MIVCLGVQARAFSVLDKSQLCLALRTVAQCVLIVIPQTLDHVFHPLLESILREDIQRLGQSLTAVVLNASLHQLWKTVVVVGP